MYGLDFEVIGKGCEGGVWIPPRWSGKLCQPPVAMAVMSGGAFIGFLLYGWFLKTITIVGEFGAMEFAVCNGLCEEMIMGLKVFYEENVWLKAG